MGTSILGVTASDPWSVGSRASQAGRKSSRSRNLKTSESRKAEVVLHDRNESISRKTVLQ